MLLMLNIGVPHDAEVDRILVVPIVRWDGLRLSGPGESRRRLNTSILIGPFVAL